MRDGDQGRQFPSYKYVAFQMFINAGFRNWINFPAQAFFSCMQALFQIANIY